MGSLPDFRLALQGPQSFLQGMNQGWGYANDARQNQLDAYKRESNQIAGDKLAQRDYLGAAQEMFKRGHVKEGGQIDEWRRSIANADINKKVEIANFLGRAWENTMDENGNVAPDRFEAVRSMTERLFGPDAVKDIAPDPDSIRALVNEGKIRTERELERLKMDTMRANLAKAERGTTNEYDVRADAARAYGLDPSSEAGRQYILTGNMPKNEVNDGLTEAYKKIDKDTGEGLVEWTASGRSDAAKNLTQLKQVRERLEDVSGGKSDGNLTGGYLDWMPDLITKQWNPEAVDTRQRVEEVVQRNLRAILGAQFTEKEGERLISRAYDPGLDESINSERVGLLFESMKRAFEEKQRAYDYLRNNGTMRGYEGIGANLSTDDIIRDFEARVAQSETKRGKPDTPLPKNTAKRNKFEGWQLEPVE